MFVLGKDSLRRLFCILQKRANVPKYSKFRGSRKYSKASESWTTRHALRRRRHISCCGVPCGVASSITVEISVSLETFNWAHGSSFGYISGGGAKRGDMAQYKGAASEAGRAMQLMKKREKEREQLEQLKQKIAEVCQRLNPKISRLGLFWAVSVRSILNSKA